MTLATKWVATVSGTGMGTFHIEADTLERLEHQLGDVQDAVGRVRWVVAEQPKEWVCDGGDGCVLGPAAPHSNRGSQEANQLEFDL